LATVVALSSVMSLSPGATMRVSIGQRYARDDIVYSGDDHGLIDGVWKYGCTRGTVFRFESIRPRDVRPVELGCY
jgi:hypothetical protein